MFFDKNGNITIQQLIEYPDQSYDRLKEEALKCERCHLREKCTQVVMGEGSLENKIMFIGEGPGADEDRLGRPFVGRAGKLLDKMFDAINISREEIYISNIVKCRPPNNRVPSISEAEACMPILKAEIKLVDPKVIVPLGSTSLKYLVDREAAITRDRGKWIQRGKYYFLPTFHPAYLLRNPGAKKQAWHDFQVIKKAIDRIKELMKNDEIS
ncbi:MAG: uracil-DNA glycosylase [Bacillota bacterium]